MKDYTEQEIENALQILDYYKGCAGGDAKSAIEKSIEIAKDCILMRNTPKWISAKESLPEQQGYGHLVKCNVILVHSRTELRGFDDEKPHTWDKEIVYSATFDTEQKIWHILEEGLYLNALVDADNVSGYFDYVRCWMYMPSIEL